MTKQLLLLFILMFSFTSCDIKEILGGKKDDKEDRGPAPSGDDPNGGGNSLGGTHSRCILAFESFGEVGDYFCIDSASLIDQQYCDDVGLHIKENAAMGVSIDSVTGTLTDEECPSSFTISESSVDSNGTCSSVTFDDVSITVKYFGQLTFGNADMLSTDCESAVFTGTFSN